MKLSLPGAGFIRHHEGFKANWYLDSVGVPTIGIGFTWASDSFRAWWKKHRPGQAFARGARMSREEADQCLIFMCEREYGAAVNDFLGKTVKQHVFDGMVSPVFNLGPGSLNWKWAKAVKAGNLSEAAERLRFTGTTAKGRKLRGLELRRQEEADLLEFGDYAIGSTSVSVSMDPMADGVLVRGEHGVAVAKLQENLANLAHYDGSIDGIFGYGTEAAVLAFQRQRGLTADGKAGPKTLRALGAKSIPAEPLHPDPSPTNASAKAPGWLIAAITLIAVAGVALAIVTGAINNVG